MDTSHNHHGLLIQAIQQKLTEAEGMLVFHQASSKQYYGIAINKQGYRMQLIEAPEDVNQFAEQFSLSKAHNYDALISSNFKLYQLFYAPFKATLSNKKRIYVIRHGALNQVPFDTFIEHQPAVADKDYSQLAYLVHHHSFIYLYSTYAFLNGKRERIAAEPLIFSPVFTPDMITDAADSIYTNIPSLKSSLSFTEALNKRYQVTTKTKQQAQVSTFKTLAPASNFIHLDTHTFLHSDDLFNKSQIAFAPDFTTDDSGLLPLQDLYTLNINPSILILGSCNTGVGHAKFGEGIMSIAYQLQIKGLSNLLYAAWSIEETATHHIFEYFYENLHQGLPTDYALQQAKITYLTTHQHWTKAHKAAPYYWSGLIMSGMPLHVDIAKKVNSLPYWLLILVLLLAIGGGIKAYQRRSENA